MIKPYYQDGLVTLYNADVRECREVLNHHSPVEVITDPVWPNASIQMFGSDDPKSMLSDVLNILPDSIKRIVIQLGCDSDPRFLETVPEKYPFLRVCWLEYVQPNYKGRLLNTSDIAYIFGEYPRPRPGQMVFPGKTLSIKSHQRGNDHPCPRRLQHVSWLVRWYGVEKIMDPFAGSGTTLLAAKNAGIPSIGFEIEESHCQVIVERLRQEVLFHGGNDEAENG